MQTICLRVRRIVFSSAHNGYTVLKGQLEGTNQTLVVVGELSQFRPGDWLQVEGEYVEHPRFGRQFKAFQASSHNPRESDALIEFFAGARFPGVGKKSAQKIVAHFGSNVLNLLEKNPELIHQVRGLSKKARQEICNHFLRKQKMAELFIRLKSVGVSNNLIHSIYAHYSEQTLDVLQTDPYRLVKDLKRVSFPTADLIGRAFNFPADSSLRIRAAIKHLLDEDEYQNGNLFIYRAELIERGQQLLQIPQEAIGIELQRLIAEGEVYSGNIQGEFIQKSFARLIECETARKIIEILQQTSLPIEVKSEDSFLSAEQKAAIRFVLQHRLAIITGPPGSGKTTIVRQLIKIFQEQRLRFSLAAPTGRAAKRMTELCAFPASTLHRLLGFDPELGRFKKNAVNPLELDVLIVDEFSMVDSYLFFFLMQAFPKKSRLIIIGDKDQLPSVCAGNVLRDLIASRRIPVFYLQTIYRQQESQLLISNALRINQGEMPVILPPRKELDFVLFNCYKPEQAREKALEIFYSFGTLYGFNSQLWQVLAPMYRGEAGIDRLNQLFQQKFNSEKIVYQKEGRCFKLGDKVLQLRNNYQKEIFNGDIGIVEDRANDALLVNFDGRKVFLNEEEIGDLTLSYVISIHKAQGSEFDFVILILLPEHSILLTRELLYTAVTRARKRLILLSNRQTIAKAIANTRQTNRQTNLLFYLQQD